MSLSRFLADDKALVTYRPKLNAATGGVMATILLQQIMYWYEKAERKPFYKFKEPCKHKAYQSGDSWTEELGFTRREFDTALRRIGQKISKGTKKDKNVLVWYWIDMDRMTMYEVNTARLDAILSEIYVKAESAVTKSTNPPLRNGANALYVKAESADRYTETTITETTTEKGEAPNFFGKFLELYGVRRSHQIETLWMRIPDAEYPKIIDHLPAYLKRKNGSRAAADCYLKFEKWINDPNPEPEKPATVLPAPTGRHAYLN